MIYVSEGCSISIRVSRLWFRLQPVPFKRINSIAISHSRSNSGSDGIFSRDNHGWNGYLAIKLATIGSIPAGSTLGLPPSGLASGRIGRPMLARCRVSDIVKDCGVGGCRYLSLIHISEPTRLGMISY